MAWKPIRLVPDGTTYPFMRWSRFGFFLSGLLCLASIYAFATIGLNFGVDFKGGTVLTVRTTEVAQLDQMRGKLNNLGLGSVELQTFGSPNDILIRLPSQGENAEVEKAAIDKVVASLGSGVELRAKETVGAKVSGELTQQATAAVMLSMLFVLIYLWARFEWQFAFGAIVSLLHDVVLTIGLFCILGLEFNLSIVAAILTIIGYSLNDTVVVFDRVREYLRRYKSLGLADLIDLSINSVLPRTMLTSVATLLALLSLYIFGGEVLRGFSFAMIWGVVVGTYSSIFVATPVLILLGTKREAEKLAKLAK